MAEYIDIDAHVVVTDTRNREHETTVRHIFEMNKGVYTAADVRPVVRGHWERTLWFVTCSVCEYTSADTDDEGSAISLNFCPNCGADMREDYKE